MIINKKSQVQTAMAVNVITNKLFHRNLAILTGSTDLLCLPAKRPLKSDLSRVTRLPRLIDLPQGDPSTQKVDDFRVTGPNTRRQAVPIGSIKNAGFSAEV